MGCVDRMICPITLQLDMASLFFSFLKAIECDMMLYGKRININNEI